MQVELQTDVQRVRVSVRGDQVSINTKEMLQKYNGTGSLCPLGNGGDIIRI